MAAALDDTHIGRMYATCLYCRAALGANEALEHWPVGRRLAFDAMRGRLWVVCRRCERWNLAPLEERWEAVEECERLFRLTRLRISTENVGLARLRDGMELVRIGNPLRPELAAWRYGDQFGRRRLRTAALVGAGAATAAVLAVGGVAPGLIVGGAAVAALHVGRPLRRLQTRGSIVCRVAVGNGDRVAVREGHLREARILTGGPWGDRWGLMVSFGTSSTVLAGMEALHVAGVLLARINRYGASRGAVQRAVDILERHGDAAHCFRYAAKRPERERHRLIKLPLEIRLALEMAAHEETEHRALEGELGVLTAAWRDAEEIAAIADELMMGETGAPALPEGTRA